MDISVYISELLYEHDCVIIPGFGGFICSYKPADIHPRLHTITPPSKSISFNRNLQSNDGLLVNHISNRNGISFAEANDILTMWVLSTQSVLKNREDVILKKTGRFFNDIEGNLQFVSDESVNYLKSSFGLKTITAEPIVRVRELERAEEVVKKIVPVRRISITRIAASIILFAMIATVVQLMRLGVEIKLLQINEAGIFSYFFPIQTPEMKPVPVEVETPVAASADTSQIAGIALPDSSILSSTPSVQISVTIPVAPSISAQPGQHNYYIIVGAFRDERNADAAKNSIGKRFPDAGIFSETSNGLTKVGYSAGTNYQQAKEQLVAARSDDSTVWLLKK